MHMRAALASILLVFYAFVFHTSGGIQLLPQVASKTDASFLENHDWPIRGGSPENSHYSPLAQINRANVKQLEVAWSSDTGEPGGLQTSPIIVDGGLYGITPTNRPTRIWLESEMQAPLHLPHVGRSIRDSSCIGHVHSCIRKSQVRVVEGIEILPPKFQGLSFRDDEILGQRKVKQVLRRPSQRALGSRTVAEGLPWGGVSGGVKPQVAVGIRDMGIPNDVRPNAVEICV
jgi:hypothetical protein